MKISASFLSIKEDLKQNIALLAHTDIDYLHVDIMDGKFVPNKTWNIYEITKIIDTSKPLDIHLMVNDLCSYVDDFCLLKPEYITFHCETEDVMKKIEYIKKKNVKVGLALKPNTKVESIVSYLPFVDLILVMSVEPGQGGQTFMEESVSKIDFLDTLRKKHDYSYVIEVDGGINDKTIQKIKKADIAVVGSFITNGNYQENLEKLK